MKSDRDIVLGLKPGARIPHGWLNSLPMQLVDKLCARVLRNDWRIEDVGDEYVVIAGKPTEAIIEVDKSIGKIFSCVSK